MEKTNIFGQRIRALRKGLKLTQEQVATQLNISVAALSRYEKGSFEPKSLALIVDLAMLYKVSTDYLLGKTDLKNPEMDPKGYFYNFQDAISALEVGVIDLHDKIVVRDEHGERLETTAGRIIFNEAVRNALA